MATAWQRVNRVRVPRNPYAQPGDCVLHMAQEIVSRHKHNMLSLLYATCLKLLIFVFCFCFCFSDHVLHPEINPLNAELNPICHFLALLGAHHILHVSGVRVKVWIIWTVIFTFFETFDNINDTYHELLPGNQLIRQTTTWKKECNIGEWAYQMLITLWRFDNRAVRLTAKLLTSSCTIWCRDSRLTTSLSWPSPNIFSAHAYLLKCAIPTVCINYTYGYKVSTCFVHSIVNPYPANVENRVSS